jgi:hypothetical protein
MNILMKYDLQCNSDLHLICPLSAFFISFTSLSISALYLFFSSNIVIELKSFFSSLLLSPREFDPLPLRWFHWVAWIFVFLICSLVTLFAQLESIITPFPLFKVMSHNQS